MLSILEARCEDDERQYTLIISQPIFQEDNKKQLKLKRNTTKGSM